MKRTSGWVLWGLALIAATALYQEPAAAERARRAPAGATPGTKKDARGEERSMKKAGELSQKGEAALQKGQLAQALQFFQQAHDAKPVPRFQYHIAECHRGMGNAGRAAFSYRQYLKYGGEIENRKEIEELAVRMEALAEAVRGALPPPDEAHPGPTASAPACPEGKAEGCKKD